MFVRQRLCCTPKRIATCRVTYQDAPSGDAIITMMFVILQLMLQIGNCLISALSISGLPTDSFMFEGFLPMKSGARKRKIESWRTEKRTVLFYESPYRIVRVLEDIKEVLGDIRVVIARELTKKFEEVIRGNVDELLEKFKKQKPRGEFVVLLNLKK